MSARKAMVWTQACMFLSINVFARVRIFLLLFKIVVANSYRFQVTRFDRERVMYSGFLPVYQNLWIFVLAGGRICLIARVKDLWRGRWVTPFEIIFRLIITGCLLFFFTSFFSTSFFVFFHGTVTEKIFSGRSARLQVRMYLRISFYETANFRVTNKIGTAR